MIYDVFSSVLEIHFVDHCAIVVPTGCWKNVLEN
jgi:hypothetical protein